MVRRSIVQTASGAAGASDNARFAMSRLLGLSAPASPQERVRSCLVVGEHKAQGTGPHQDHGVIGIRLKRPLDESQSLAEGYRENGTDAVRMSPELLNSISKSTTIASPVSLIRAPIRTSLPPRSFSFSARSNVMLSPFWIPTA